MNELRRLTHKRRSITKSEDLMLAANGGARTRSATGRKDQGMTVVKLTKSGQDMYEIVKKCIQETWRLLDQRYYGELTKAVYGTVVTQMIYLVQVYSSQITEEINNRAPKELTTYRRSLGGGSMAQNTRKRGRRASLTRKNVKGPSPGGVTTIIEGRQMDDEKGDH